MTLVYEGPDGPTEIEGLVKHDQGPEGFVVVYLRGGTEDKPTPFKTDDEGNKMVKFIPVHRIYHKGPIAFVEDDNVHERTRDRTF
jgi:hypothetical protein